MLPKEMSFQALLCKIEKLQVRLEEAEETLRAIGCGEVDAFVVSGPDGKQIFTLKGAEHPYRVLVETMNEGAATLAHDGTILYCNQSLATMLQLPLESLIGNNIVSHVSREDQASFTARFSEYAAECDRVEMSMVTGKGSTLPVMISYCSFDHSGMQGISVAVTDLTQQKRNEEFMAAERLARSIIDQAGEAIIVCDESGRIIRASRLAFRLCAESPLLKKFDKLFKLKVTETGRYISLLPLVADQVYKNVEVEYTNHDDKVSYFILNMSPLKGSHQQIIGFIVTLTDFTERKLIKEQLLALNEELERRVELRTRDLQETQAQYLHAEKLSAIGTLSASIAHEFNNPLQSVMTILKGMRKLLENEDREMLELAINESERMKNLIRSLQDFNRPSSGKIELMDVHELLESLLLLCKSDFKQKGIVTRLDYAKDLPQVMAIPDQIKQVFLNLLNNAADACMKSGGEIMIITRQEDNRIAVAIKDNGTGIEPDRMDLIFQPFYTTKPEVKGTGLGLSVCHGIMQHHQGEIRVESQAGKGSTFTILLPLNSNNRDTIPVEGQNHQG